MKSGVGPYKEAPLYGDIVGSSSETPQQLLVRALGIEPEQAAVLVTNGITTLEEVAYVPIDELRSVAGINEQLVQACRAQARRHLRIQAVGGGDDDDALPAAIRTPPEPRPGGSGATVDHESR